MNFKNPKLHKSIILLVFAFTGLSVIAHDFFLLPDDFFLRKGDQLKVKLFVGDEFKDLKERKYESTKTNVFRLHGSKVLDLKPLSQDSVMPILDYKMQEEGLALVEMTRNYADISMTKENFIEYLEEERLNKMDEEIKTSDKTNFKEKYTRYLKTLVNVEKPNGSLYAEKLGHELEIILNKNPYKTRYGDDISATIFFKKKPLPGAAIEVLVKSGQHEAHITPLTTDKEGTIFFKLNREGVYLIRMVYMEKSKDAGVDYESWWASYSFGFRLKL